MDHGQLAELLFSGLPADAGEISGRYPPRALAEGAMVTRLAPSPTGEVHIGSLYAAFLSQRLAAQSGGVFYVRLDDTDQKRETPGTRARIPAMLRAFGVDAREGYPSEAGAYGPYVQSARRDIYRAFAKRLVEEGKAYPCFLREEELREMRERQRALGAPVGCHGAWAMCRDLSLNDIRRLLAERGAFTLRLRSSGDANRRVIFRDLFRGEISMPENIQDIVLLKSDGLPTYHFAHAVDDHLMGTTHVLRGDEWLSSYPVHRQLFEALGWAEPVYGHLAPIMKKEGASRRKFSKRRDADGHAAYYAALGIPPLALREYFMRLINSDYEDWRRAHPGLPLEAFRIDIARLGGSGPVFDMDKLLDIARDAIAALDADEACDQLTGWAAERDPAFHALLAADPAYARAVLGIGRGGPKPRKDIAKWADVRPLLGYFWDAFFPSEPPTPAAHERALLRAYADAYDPSRAKDAWYAHLKQTAAAMGYAPDKRAYAARPDAYAGTLSDAAAVIRRALTGRETSPDLYDVMRVMGVARVRGRLLGGGARSDLICHCPSGIPCRGDRTSVWD